MRTALLSLIAGTALAAAAPLASAGIIHVSDIGGGLTLNSGPLASTVFGNSQPAWTTTSLATVHSALNARGIATNGKVTFVPADTDHGLAFLALVDQQANPQPPVALGNLNMVTVGSSTSVAFVNGTSVPINESTSGSQIAAGPLSWNSNGGGTGFAWANLVNGDTMTFRFNTIDNLQLGLDQPNTFQFVTWNGSNWDLVAIPTEQASFTITGELGLSAHVTTIPTPGGFVLAGLGALAVTRRRR